MNSAHSHDVRPAWYELSLKGDTTLCFKVHRVALAEIQKLKWKGAPGVEDKMKRFKLPSFIAPCEGDCGFMNVFKSGKSENEHWIAWECELPKIKTYTTETEPSWQYTISIRCTLNMFFCIALWMFEGNTGWHKPQLMFIEGICLPDSERRSSGDLSVTLMPPVMPWLAKHEDCTHIQPVVDAMKKASEHMWPRSSSHGRFEALFQKPKRLTLSVPGDACILSRGDFYDDASLDKGYTLHPHNIDSSLQQLTFLAGLAKLHDLVREG
jgi:hypothetical protein